MDSACEFATAVSRYQCAGTVRGKSGARDLSPGELRLGQANRDQESGRIFDGFRRSVTRLQALPHLFAGNVTRRRLCTKILLIMSNLVNPVKHTFGCMLAASFLQDLHDSAGFT